MFNRHKIKRKWKRRLKKKSKRFLYDETNAKDFAWKNRKKNPYKNDTIPFFKKPKVQIAIIFICLLLSIGILIYHPFFRIKYIEVNGLQRIDKQEFLSAAKGIVDYKMLFVLPKSNFFLFSESEVVDILGERFPFESVQVEMYFPNRISINVQEKVSTLIYDNGEEYSYVGLDGKVIEILRKVGESEWVIEKEIVTSTDEFGDIIEHENIVSKEHFPDFRGIVQEFGDYPVVYDTREMESKVQNAVLKESTAQSIFDWFWHLQRKTDIPLQYIIFESEIGDAVIKTGEGWRIKVKLNGSIERQFSDLELVLREKVDRDTLNYIDLRYPGKVYWQ